MDPELSYLDCETGRLHLVMTRAGVLESLLQLSLSTTSGLTVSGWLEPGEGGAGARTCHCQPGGDRERQLVFSIQPGAHYQLGTVVRWEVNMI